MRVLSAIASYPSTYPVVASFLVIALSVFFAMPLFKKRFDPKGKYCYVTGASTGLGHAVASHLLKHGASICIVSRDAARNAEAKASLESLAAPGQKVHAVCADLTDAKESARALDEAVELGGGRVPDAAFLCAGASWPRYFLDSTTEDLKQGLDASYWIQAFSAHAITQKMVANRIKGKIVFVGSFLGYSTFVGYSGYSPGKYALRGLADVLRNELLIHDISVHMFMPAGIDSPGHVVEQRHKPAPTKKLEDGDTLQSPEVVAAHLFRGIDRGYYQPTTYPITELMRVHSKGGVPGNNPVMDFLYWIGSGIGMPIWVTAMDWIVKGYKKEVQADLERRGFYVVPKKD